MSKHTCLLSACAFWMIFGGDKVPQAYQGSVEADNNTIIVEGLQDPNALLYSLFRMTLVDDYDYDVSSVLHTKWPA